MTSSTSSSELLARLVAVLVPVLLLGSAAAWFLAPREEPKSPAALAMEARLAEKAPRVVVLGNSIAEHAVDTAALGAGLGGRPVLGLTVYASPPPTWYAVLKNRVLGAGHKPELVLVVSSLDFFLQTEVRTELQRRALAEQMGLDEPVIQERTFGGGGLGMPARVRLRRSELRDELIDAGRLFFLRADGTSPGFARERARRASQRVFDEDDRSDQDLRKRVIPVLEPERRERSRGEPSLEQTYVPPMAALAREAGIQLVFVRAPLPPSSQTGATVDPARLRELVVWLNQAGVGWIDLSGMALGEGSFRDGTHLNKGGQKAFTRALLDELRRIGADQGGALLPARLPLALGTVERSGTMPRLPELSPAAGSTPCRLRFDLPGLDHFSTNRLQDLELHNASPLRVLQGERELQRLGRPEDLPEGCQGSFAHKGKTLWVSPFDGERAAPRLALVEDAAVRTPKGRAWYWVYPGTGLSFEIQPEPGELLVQVEALALAQGGSLELRLVDAEGRPLARAELAPVEGAVPSLREASLRLPAESVRGSSSLRLVLESPVEGETALVSALSLGPPDARSWLIGRDSQQGSVRLVGGKANALQYDGPAPLIAPKVKAAAGPRPGVGKIWAPGLAALSSGAIQKVTGEYDCSPVQVLEDDEPLPGRHAKCSKLQEGSGRPGDYCHGGKQIFFRPRGGGDPLQGGLAFRLRLDPEPFCKGMWWLYPGQPASRVLKRKDLRALSRASSRLRLAAVALPDSGDLGRALHIVLQSDDVSLLDQQVPLSSLGPTPVDLPLSASVSAATPGLSLRLQTPPEAAYLLIQTIALEVAEPTVTDEAIPARTEVHP